MKFIAPIHLIAAVAALCLATRAFAKPVNVLVLVADDLRYDTLRIAGNPIVK